MSGQIPQSSTPGLGTANREGAGHGRPRLRVTRAGTMTLVCTGRNESDVQGAGPMKPAGSVFPAEGLQGPQRDQRPRAFPAEAQSARRRQGGRGDGEQAGKQTGSRRGRTEGREGLGGASPGPLAVGFVCCSPGGSALLPCPDRDGGRASAGSPAGAGPGPSVLARSGTPARARLRNRVRFCCSFCA